MALTDTAGGSNQVTAVTGVATATTTVSPAAGAMVVVNFTWMFATNALGVTFTVSDNHGNTYTLPAAANDGGGGAIYEGGAYFVYSTAPGSTTVKVTASNTATAASQITTRIATGQASSPVGAVLSTNNGGTSTSTCTGSITTTTAGSQVYWALGINSNSPPTAFTAATGNTLVQSWFNASFGEADATGKVTAQTGTPGAQTVGGTTTGAAQFGFGIFAFEVLPAPSNTPKALADSGTASEADAVAVAVTYADTGAGSEAASVGAVALPLAESGAQAEALLLAAALTLTESGAGSDAFTATQAVAPSDTGSSTQAILSAAAVPLTQAGTASEAFTAGITILLPDTGAGAESLAPAADVEYAEAGAGTDAAAAGILPDLEEFGSCDDTSGFSVVFQLFESGTASEALAIGVSVADAGTGADALGGPAVGVVLTEGGAAGDLPWQFPALDDAAFPYYADLPQAATGFINVGDTFVWFTSQ